MKGEEQAAAGLASPIAEQRKEGGRKEKRKSRARRRLNFFLFLPAPFLLCLHTLVLKKVCKQGRVRAPGETKIIENFPQLTYCFPLGRRYQGA